MKNIIQKMLLGIFLLIICGIFVSASCIDGIDNDDDGYIDVEDIGCLDQTDASEIAFGYQLVTDSDIDNTCLEDLKVDYGKECLSNNLRSLSWYLAYLNPSLLDSCLVDNSYGFSYDSEKNYTNFALADCVYIHADDYSEILSGITNTDAELYCLEVFYDDYSSNCVEIEVTIESDYGEDCSSLECVDPYVCSASDVCVECVDSSTCVDGFGCDEYGGCYNACTADTQCADGYECDTDLGSCVEKAITSSECSENCGAYACSDGVCLDSCASNDECSDDYECWYFNNVDDIGECLSLSENDYNGDNILDENDGLAYCNDEDEGLNYLISSKVIGSYSSETDVCFDNNLLKEYSCDRYAVIYENIVCSIVLDNSDAVCKDGACVITEIEETAEIEDTTEVGNCDDGSDNDLDGLEDCEDNDCDEDTYCKLEICDGFGLDEDTDDLIDCEDPDCIAENICLEVGNCDDGSDNDLDGLEDCEDNDCDEDSVCVLTTESDCNDYIDNDQDHLIDITGGCDIDDDWTIDYLCGCDKDKDGDIDEYAFSQVCSGSYICLDLATNKIDGITCGIGEDIEGVYYLPDEDCTVSTMSYAAGLEESFFMRFFNWVMIWG